MFPKYVCSSRVWLSMYSHHHGVVLLFIYQQPNNPPRHQVRSIMPRLEILRINLENTEEVFFLKIKIIVTKLLKLECWRILYTSNGGCNVQRISTFLLCRVKCCKIYQNRLGKEKNTKSCVVVDAPKAAHRTKLEDGRVGGSPLDYLCT